MQGEVAIGEKQDCPFCVNPIFKDSSLDHPRKIAELEVSTAVLGRTEQYFRGYTLLVLRGHATELFDLDPETRRKFVEDATRLASALAETFHPIKMNYCLLGNTVEHLHWHLIPRRHTDPDPKRPIWESPFPNVQLSDDDFQSMAHEIRGHL